MNIFHKVTLESMKRSRTRTLVTVIGVALSAAMVTAVLTFAVSLLSYMLHGAIAKYGDWHVAFPDADAAFMQARRADADVSAAVSFENLGYARLEGGNRPDKPYLFLAGYSEETFDALPVTLFSGRMPSSSGEALLCGKVATEAGVKLSPGDTLTLTVGERMLSGQTLGQSTPYSAEESFVPTGELCYTIVGICQRPRYEEDDAPGYTLITCADETGSAESFSLFLKLRQPRQTRAYAEKAAGGRSYVLNDNVLRFLGVSESNLFNGVLYATGGIVIAIIMIGSILLIYNSFRISLNERTQQFGILMSVGATARQLRNSVLFEGLCIGAVGIPIGVLAGIGCTALIIGLVARNFTNILYASVPLTLTVSMPALLAAIAVSLATILLSAYIPARRAAVMPVMECIRQSNEIKLEGKAVRTPAFVQRLYGLEGALALKNFKRNKKRYQSIVLSLVLSVVLFVSASAFVTDLTQISGGRTEVTTYDIAFTARDMSDEDMCRLFDKMKLAGGVRESAYQALVSYTGAAGAEAMTADYRAFALTRPEDECSRLPLQLQFLDEESFMRLLANLALPAEAFTGPDAKLLSVAQFHDGSEDKSLFSGAETELVLTPKTGGTPRRVRVVNVLFVPPDVLPVLEASAVTPYYIQLIAPYSLKDRFLAPGVEADMKGMTFLSDAPAKTAAEMEGIIEGAGVTEAYSLYNMNRLMDESRNYIFIANVFAYAFIAMISLIAIANVFNTISTNIKLRRRELAMLRSVGMAERDFQRMMNFECAFYGARALCVGLPLAALLSWLIYKGMFIGGAEGIAFVMPWKSLGISAVSVLLIVFITMLYAVASIKRASIIDALRDDMT